MASHYGVENQFMSELKSKSRTIEPKENKQSNSLINNEKVNKNQDLENVLDPKEQRASYNNS